MKYLLKNVACAITLLFVFNCTTEPLDNTSQDLLIQSQSQENNLDTTTCNGESPKAMVTNNSNLDVEFMIYDANAIKILVEPNIAVNTCSSWATLPAGETTFAIVNNSGGDKIVVLDIDVCMNFNFEIDANNNVSYTVSTPDSD